MKLTKSQLKQIIKEEIEEILPRQPNRAAAKTYDELAEQIAEMIRRPRAGTIWRSRRDGQGSAPICTSTGREEV